VEPRRSPPQPPADLIRCGMLPSYWTLPPHRRPAPWCIPFPQHLARWDALASPVPLPPPLLHIVGRGTDGGRATAGTPRVVTAVGMRQRAPRARVAQAAFGQGPRRGTPAH
jgi:hypothetical protein